ncbi:MAG: hypothetical protein M3153_10225 [Chloroflexota bacterium]|nr:hypothetical protein [Chloroflexota bacterium]
MDEGGPSDAATPPTDGIVSADMVDVRLETSTRRRTQTMLMQPRVER